LGSFRKNLSLGSRNSWRRFAEFASEPSGRARSWSFRQSIRERLCSLVVRSILDPVARGFVRRVLDSRPGAGGFVRAVFDVLHSSSFLSLASFARFSQHGEGRYNPHSLKLASFGDSSNRDNHDGLQNGFVSQKLRVVQYCLQHASSDERFARLGSFRRIALSGPRPRKLGSFVAFSHLDPEAGGFVRRVFPSSVLIPPSFPRGFVRRVFDSWPGCPWVRWWRFTALSALVGPDAPLHFPLLAVFTLLPGAFGLIEPCHTTRATVASFVTFHINAEARLEAEAGPTTQFLQPGGFVRAISRAAPDTDLLPTLSRSNPFDVPDAPCGGVDASRVWVRLVVISLSTSRPRNREHGYWADDDGLLTTRREYPTISHYARCSAN
jgi:hypothetical protein